MFFDCKIFLFSFLMVVFGPSSICGATTNETNALMSLYNSTDGTNWKNNLNWMDGDPCTNLWHGVTCLQSHIVKLKLRKNSLIGEIPSDIGGLSYLIAMNLNSNKLETIPTEIGQLSNLEYLLLSEDSINGTIPTEIGELSQLTHLDLSINSLLGPIPTEIGLISNMSIVYLNDNSLSGSIPTEIGNFLNLTVLYFSFNELSGSIPTQIGNIPLFSLNVERNSLGGTIPTEMGNCLLLETIILNDNQLTGSIPTELGNMTILLSMFLNDNSLSGTIPNELTTNKRLSSLDFSSNLLKGPIPSALVPRHNIPFYLNVSHNHLSGSILDDNWLCNVTTLDLSANFINCPLLSCCSEKGNGGCVMSSEIPCYPSS